MRKKRTDSGGYIAAGASVTVEASLVFPLFFFFIWMVWQLFLVVLLQTGITISVAKTAGQLSAAGYVQRNSSGKDCTYAEALWLPALYLNILSGNEKFYDNLNVDFKEEEDSVYIIEVTADIPIAAPFYNRATIRLRQDYKVRANTGVWDENAFKDQGPESENKEKVYVTENGTVYHRDKACSYLSINAEAVPVSDIKEKRNRSGHKYTECKYCRNAACSGSVYITAYGTKYHYDAKCHVLNRSTREVDLEEVKDMKPCSRCGGKANDRD